LTGRVLLWVTSQSGESGEVAALVEQGTRAREATLIATTNVPTSTLARAADIVICLGFGEEAAVSTKSYLNTLAAHERALNALRHHDDAESVVHILSVATALDVFQPDLGPLAAAALAPPTPRFAFVGSSSGLANALIAALMLKEVAKLPAEGYLAGEFRHGPIEIAGPGLVVLLYGSGVDDVPLTGLATELVESGALVVPVDAGASAPLSPWAMTTRTSSNLGRLACGAKLAQLFSAQLALARSVEPGQFRFGQKVTASI